MLDEMREYFDGHQWKEISFWDGVLHRAVNRSLDLTIDSVLGRANFERRLDEFRIAKAAVTEQCLPTLRLPCTADGRLRRKTDCLYDDMGCGFDCMDRVMKALATSSL